MSSIHTRFQTHFLRGQEALDRGDAESAYRYWCRCNEDLPNDVNLKRQLIHAFRAIGRLDQANRLISEAQRQQPDLLVFGADQAVIALDQGQAEQAAELFVQLANSAKQTVAPVEQTLSLLSNALMALEYSTAPASISKLLAQRWGILATDWASKLVQAADIPAWTPKQNAKEPLRIGFISSDLCDHPVGFLLLPLLQSRHLSTWTPYIYDNGSRLDSTNRQLQAQVPQSQWHLIDALSDADAMRVILTDQLDILVDLSGHSGRNRLRLMAHRLAGKQISWLGFSGTTGLATSDGIVLDPILSTGCDDQFVEPTLHINPSRFCFRPPFAPPLTPPPCAARGYVTFGSFNNTAKYNPELLATWAVILKRVANSRLLLKWRTFADAEFSQKILNDFAKLGIASDRIELRGFSTHRQMLDEYHEVDIALDPFPFNGGFTSLEALWMGLPLVSLLGDRPIGRQSGSFLAVLGKSDWIGQTTNDYVRIAEQLAANPEALAETRKKLRFEIMDSPLYDASAFGSTFVESLVRQLSISR